MGRWRIHEKAGKASEPVHTLHTWLEQNASRTIHLQLRNEPRRRLMCSASVNVCRRSSRVSHVRRNRTVPEMLCFAPHSLACLCEGLRGFRSPENCTSAGQVSASCRTSVSHLAPVLSCYPRGRGPTFCTEEPLKRNGNKWTIYIYSLCICIYMLWNWNYKCYRQACMYTCIYKLYDYMHVYIYIHTCMHACLPTYRHTCMK